MEDPGSLALHFDGSITTDHLVSARTLGKALTHSQNAIDRAYLDLKYRNLWKYARMSGEDYEAADFVAVLPERGGFIQKLTSDVGQPIIDRISSALRPAVERVMEEGEIETERLVEQAEARARQFEDGYVEPRSYEDLVAEPDERSVRSYADRAIVREFDQILSIIRSPQAGGSTLEITAQGQRTEQYTFDAATSKKFHRIVAKREIGAPVIYSVRVRSLDRELLKGKVMNLANEKASAIYFVSEQDFLQAHPFLGDENEVMNFIGAPVIEYGAFDPNAGDIYFIALVS